jgi:tripartite-type tricarboxylate transporter receptor subunit TctC
MKYSTWKDVPTSKSLNIAYVGGVGSVHDIISYELLKKYPNARSIPFKNSVEALTGLRLGDVDLYVVPYGSVHDWGERYDIHFLGVAGSKTIDGIPTLISQGFDGIIAKAVSVHMMLVPTNVDPVKAQEWRDILTKASRSEETAKAYSIQYCNMYPIMTQKEQNDWYKDQQDSWKKLTTGIDLKE